VAAVLLALIFPQTPGALLAAALTLAPAFTGAILLRLLGRARDDLAIFGERVASLETRLGNQRATIGAIERQGRRAERNRLAARIHDRVGHGMTGSILMLEAAQLQLEQDPQEARRSIETATENLRGSVEDIRRELREERAADEPISLARIAAELEGFAAEHSGVGTELAAEGALDGVPQAVWLCVFEGLRETLTNLLKHSDANRFRVGISQRNRLLTVEFGDNGRPVSAGAGLAGGSTAQAVLRLGDGALPDMRTLMGRGIGLVAIEERTLLGGGRAFFTLSPHGFTTRLIFTLGGWA
jgi:signal transduction histidine kinase